MCVLGIFILLSHIAPNSYAASWSIVYTWNSYLWGFDDNGYPTEIYVLAAVGSGYYEMTLALPIYEFLGTEFLIKYETEINNAWIVTDEMPRADGVTGEFYPAPAVFAICNNTILHQCNSYSPSHSEISSQPRISGFSIIYCFKAAAVGITELVIDDYDGNIGYTYYGEYSGKWSFRSIDTNHDKFIYYDARYSLWIISDNIGNNSTIYGICTQENIFKCGYVNGTDNGTVIDTEPWNFIFDRKCENRITPSPTASPTMPEYNLPSDVEIIDLETQIKTHYWFNGNYYLDRRVYETLTTPQYILYWQFKNDIYPYTFSGDSGRWQFDIWKELTPSPTSPPTRSDILIWWSVADYL